MAPGTPLKSAVATKFSHAAIVAEGATIDPAVFAVPKNIGSGAAGITFCARVEFVPPTVVPFERRVPRGFEPKINSLRNVRD